MNRCEELADIPKCENALIPKCKIALIPKCKIALIPKCTKEIDSIAQPTKTFQPQLTLTISPTILIPNTFDPQQGPQQGVPLITTSITPSGQQPQIDTQTGETIAPNISNRQIIDVKGNVIGTITSGDQVVDRRGTLIARFDRLTGRAIDAVGKLIGKIKPIRLSPNQTRQPGITQTNLANQQVTQHGQQSSPNYPSIKISINPPNNPPNNPPKRFAHQSIRLGMRVGSHDCKVSTLNAKKAVRLKAIAKATKLRQRG